MRHYAAKKPRSLRWLLLAVALAFAAAAAIFFQPLAHLESSFAVKSGTKQIGPVLARDVLTEKAYQFLFYQTGLGKSAIDKLRSAPEYKKEDILQYQKAFFERVQTECVSTNLFTKRDQVKREDGAQTPLVPVENGDILLSFSSHTLGWRHGHAGMVIDAGKGLCLEAEVLGRDSQVRDLSHWQNYSNFAVLRLRDISFARRDAIAAFAARHLIGVPYSLTSGVFGNKAPAVSKDVGLTAQCAYLIWYAFFQFGYDLDSDGGKVVTVDDIAKSDLLEAVQIFGMDPEQFFYT